MNSLPSISTERTRRRGKQRGRKVLGIVCCEVGSGFSSWGQP
jgi:hypothetical protein